MVSASSTAARQAGVSRASELAERLEQGARALVTLASSLADDEWRMPLPHDGRPIGVVVHHVATVYPIEVELAMRLASGESIVGVTMADIHAMNAAHAAEHATVGKGEAIALLATNSAAAASVIRTLSDAQLDAAAPASLYGGAPVTCQFVLEDHAVRHSYHHAAGIRAALQARPVDAVSA